MTNRKPRQPGTGWVEFEPTSPTVLAALEHYDLHHDRNVVTTVSQDPLRARWTREPNGLGQGVAQGNEVSDFLRVAARALFKVNVVDEVDKNGAELDYREVVAKLVRVVDHGWTPSTVPPVRNQILVELADQTHLHTVREDVADYLITATRCYDAETGRSTYYAVAFVAAQEGVTSSPLTLFLNEPTWLQFIEAVTHLRDYPIPA